MTVVFYQLSCHVIEQSEPFQESLNLVRPWSIKTGREFFDEIIPFTPFFRIESIGQPIA